LISYSDSKPSPEPYTRDEFSAVLHDLRRAEIIAVGAFPFTLLIAAVVYDYARWAGQGFEFSEAPFRRPLGADPFENPEKIGISLAAVGLAFSIALADYLLGQAEMNQSMENAKLEYNSELIVTNNKESLLPVSLATIFQSSDSPMKIHSIH
jgi:hypothetical protein